MRIDIAESKDRKGHFDDERLTGNWRRDASLAAPQRPAREEWRRGGEDRPMRPRDSSQDRNDGTWRSDRPPRQRTYLTLNEGYFDTYAGDEREPVGQWRRSEPLESRPAPPVAPVAIAPKQNKSNPFGAARPVDQSTVLKRVEDKIAATAVAKTAEGQSASDSENQPKPAEKSAEKPAWRRGPSAAPDASAPKAEVAKKEEAIFSGGSPAKPRAFDKTRDVELEKPWRRAQ